MSVTVLIELRARPDAAEQLLDLLAEILPGTRADPGFETLSLLRLQDDPAVVVSVETWTSRPAFETYFQWRQQQGTIAALAAHLAAPPSIRFFDTRA